MCLACLYAHVPTSPACSRANVPYVLMCSSACFCLHMPTCLACLRAHVSTYLCVPTCSCTKTVNIKNKFSMTYFPLIFGIFYLSFSCETKLYLKRPRPAGMSLEIYFENFAVYSRISLTIRKPLTGPMTIFVQ